jgi:DNA-binding response OmpR family regulator
MRFEKIMLVGSEIPPPLMELLLDTGSRVTKLPSAKTAVSHAQRELFDAAIIVSTGEEMDLAETVFNLRDINRSMLVIIVSDRGDSGEGAIRS